MRLALDRRREHARELVRSLAGELGGELTQALRPGSSKAESRFR